MANSLGNSVTVINAASQSVAATLSGSFSQPFHLAANPITGKVYVSNFGSASVTVLNGTTISRVVSLYDSGQPYGLAVDELRNMVYVATVSPHRIVAIGPSRGIPDQFLGWAAFYRGFGNPRRPLPLRVIAVNPGLGPTGDGGHLWTTTSTTDGSEQNQALFIPKGWGGYFHTPLAQNVGAKPTEGLAIDRLTNRVYIASGVGLGTVTVLGDAAAVCAVVSPASAAAEIAVFSAPLTIHEGKRKSLTDLALIIGRKSEDGEIPDITPIKQSYTKILSYVSDQYRPECQKMVDSFLGKALKAFSDASEKHSFADDIRSRALAFSGEILMSHVMSYILKSGGLKSDVASYDNWPIITDNNIESTNFLSSESAARLGPLEELVKNNQVKPIGGFIGTTVDGIETTYERGGSDRTAADLGILFHKKYDTRIDFEKDSAVVSADPRVVAGELEDITYLSYNEARIAGMFGMKILDPIAIKEILETVWICQS